MDDGFWEYITADNSTWQPLNSATYSNRFPLDITVEELDNLVPEDLLDLGIVRLRFTLTATGSGSSRRFAAGTMDSGVSNLPGDASKVIGTYIVDIIPSIPQLDATISPNPEPLATTCNGSSDGGFRVTFDRELANGETMFLNVFDTNDNPVDGPVNSLSVVDFTNRTFTFRGSNLPSGQYYLEWIVSGTAGNNRNNPFTIESPTPIVIDNTDVTQTSCENPLGSVVINASGGGLTSTPNIPLEYSIVGSGVWQSSPIFDDLTPNGYEFIARSASNSSCQSAPTNTVTINSFTNPVQLLNPTVQRPIAPGLSNGEITVSVLGATPNITYRLFALPNMATPLDVFSGAITTHTFVGLQEGEYLVQVEDANGCTRESDAITLDAIPVPVLGAPNITDISCNGFTDAAVGIGISDGELPYSFSWSRNGVELESGTLNNPTFSRNNLEPGDYQLAISSAGVAISAGAPAVVTSGSILISDAPEVTLLADGIAFACNNDGNGGIQVQASGGTSYEYQLGGPASPWLALPASNIVPVPVGGFYTLQIRNQNGCGSNIVTNIQVVEPDVLQVEEDIPARVNVSTNGGNDGAITISVNGGTAPYAFLWTGPNGFSATTQNIASLFAGSYQVTVTDANGCSTMLPDSITLTEPGPLGITGFTTVNVLCKGENTGSVTPIVEGTAPFAFEWTGPNGFTSTEQSISNLVAGTYQLTLSDSSSNPPVVDTVTLTEPDEALSANATPTAKSCSDLVDGSVDLVASGGTAPYQYSLDGGNTFQNQQQFTGLEAQTYTYVIRDASGCLFLDTVTIDSPEELMVTLVNSTNVTTNGGNDGAINITIVGGSPNTTGDPYDILWTGPNGFNASTQNITNLFAGIYQIVVTDANGCSASLPVPVEIFEPGPLTLGNPQATVTNVGCFGEATGSITANFSGEAPFIVVWFDNGVEIEQSTTTNSINGLPVGLDYSYSVTDASGLTLTSDSISILGPDQALSASATSTSVSCFNGNDGILQIMAVGGTPPYRYSRDGGNTFQNSTFFIGLVSDTYDVLVLDSNDCEVELPNLPVDQPEQLALEFEVTNVSEAGASNGSIAITVSGGTAPYSYEWTSDIGFTSTAEDIQNLMPGNYFLNVTDANGGSGDFGCSLSRGFSIVEPGALLIQTEILVPLECHGDEFGELSVTATGGVLPYTYQWFLINDDGSTTDLNSNGEEIGNLGAGTYSVRVTDFNGIFRDSEPVNLDAPEELIITIETVTGVNCFEATTGAIDIAISGGTAPYTVLWSNGAVSEDISNLAAGTYVVSVLDVNGCFLEREILVEQRFDPLMVESFEITNVSNFGWMDGAISIELSGGAPPYQLVWRDGTDNSVIGNTATIENLIAGNYSLEVIDNNSCLFVETFTVTQPDIIDAVVVPPTCNGGDDGSISLSVNQGTATNVTYTWNTGDSSASLSNLSAGTYTVVINGLSNESITREYLLEDPLPITVDLGDDQILCLDQTTELDATVEDIQAQYSWTSDTGFTSTSPRITVSDTGTYTVTVVSASGCVASGSIGITATDEEISADFAIANQVFVDEVFVAVDLSFPVPEALTWLYPEEAEIIREDEDALELRFAQAGTYEIGILTAVGNCIALETKQVLVLDRDNIVNNDGGNGEQNGISEFILAPNPTNGSFSAFVAMKERGNISIKIFQFSSNNLVAEVNDRGRSEYTIPMDISGNPSGFYAVVLETPFGTTLRKLVML